VINGQSNQSVEPYSPDAIKIIETTALKLRHFITESN